MFRVLLSLFCFCCLTAHAADVEQSVAAQYMLPSPLDQFGGSTGTTEGERREPVAKILDLLAISYCPFPVNFTLFSCFNVSKPIADVAQAIAKNRPLKLIKISQKSAAVESSEKSAVQPMKINCADGRSIEIAPDQLSTVASFIKTFCDKTVLFAKAD